MTDPHTIAVDQVRMVLADTEAAIAMFTLAEMLGEDEAVCQEYGHIVYDRLGEALGIDPNSRAALAIVTALADTRRPEDTAMRMLDDLRAFDETGAMRPGLLGGAS